MPLHGTLSGSQLLVNSDVASDYVAIFANGQGSGGHGLKVQTDGNGAGSNVFDVERDTDGTGKATVSRVRAGGKLGMGLN